MLASNYLEIVQNVIQIARHSLLLRYVPITIDKAGFIYYEAVMTPDTYDERSGDYKLNNAIKEILRTVCAGHSFGPPKAMRFKVMFVEEKNEKSVTVYANTAIFPYQYSDKWQGAR